jgi:hypothetical protein
MKRQLSLVAVGWSTSSSDWKLCNGARMFLKQRGDSANMQHCQGKAVAGSTRPPIRSEKEKRVLHPHKENTMKKEANTGTTWAFGRVSCCSSW